MGEGDRQLTSFSESNIPGPPLQGGEGKGGEGRGREGRKDDLTDRGKGVRTRSGISHIFNTSFYSNVQKLLKMSAIAGKLRQIKEASIQPHHLAAKCSQTSHAKVLHH